MKKRKVIIDCDPGIDDSLAIMLALKSPEIEVIGITIVCGNSPVEMGFGNAKKILKQMNRLDVPVYIGESTPLRRDYVNALDTHGEDGLGESFLPEVTGYHQQISAVDFLADVLKKEKVSIIELAPMTNLARLIQKDKEAFSCIEEIVSMGGSFKSHGNCSPVAEYNYWCDPDGASLVYETLHQNGQKIHMVGLDVTRKIVLTPDLLEYMCRLNKETGEFVINLTTEELAYATDYCGVKSGKDEDKFKNASLTKEPAKYVKAPLIKESPVNIECQVTDVVPCGSHDMFVAKVLCVHADKKYMDENGKFHLNDAGLVAYSHGEYFELGEKLGKFGYSVAKKQAAKPESVTKSAKPSGAGKKAASAENRTASKTGAGNRRKSASKTGSADKQKSRRK